MARSVGREKPLSPWAFFLHLSQLLGWMVPVLGWVVPILIWQLKKADLPGLDPHGKSVANWILSAIIYGVVFGMLSVVLVGIPFLVVLGVLTVVFPVVGAIKANDGEVWKYPLSIAFFK